MDYTYFVSSSVSGISGLQNKLEAVQSHGSSDVVTVYVSPGTYRLTTRHYFQCNLRIIGVCGTPEIQISSTVLSQNASNTSGLQDSFIFVQGSDSDYLNVTLENLKFTTQNSTKVLQETLFVKAEYCNNVVIKNVESNAKNGALTNFDLRDCLNIRVEGCRVINTNYVSSSTVIGGCLWIRGEVNCATISGSYMLKDGNDEAIAFWGPTTRGNLNIPTKKSNIDIHHNTLVYSKATQGLSTLYSPCDVFIKFFNTDTGTRVVNWSNVSFHDNVIKLEGFCRRVLAFSLSANDTWENIQIANNKIIHSNQTTNSAFTSIVDFEITGSGQNADISATRGLKEGVRIEGNVVISSEKMSSASAAHVCLNVNAAAVNFQGNQIYATKQLSETAGNVMLYQIAGSNSSLQISSNKCYGLKRLGSVASVTAGYSNINLQVLNNFFDGPIWQYLPRVSNSTFFFGENICINGNYFMMFQELGTGNEVEIVNNVFQRGDLTTDTGCMCYKENPVATHTINLKIVGNNLIGYNLATIKTASTHENTWGLGIKIIANNTSTVES